MVGVTGSSPVERTILIHNSVFRILLTVYRVPYFKMRIAPDLSPVDLFDTFI